MFIPIRTDRPQRHLPWVNYALIAANVLVFAIWRDQTVAALHVGDAPFHVYFLSPSSPRLIQFITYQFLHADIWHLVGNMLFLYIFGNPVEDRLGKIGYLAFYLAGGVVAGLGHAMLAASPVLGASGAVCAVTGAYLALFPMSHITMIYWFYFIGTFEIVGWVLILFQIAQDLFMQLGRMGNTAYMAHLAGYGFGFLVGMSLLWSRVLAREPYDLLALINHYRRRREFVGLAQQGYRPWVGGKSGAPATEKASPQKPLTPKEQEIMALRAEVGNALMVHDLSAAAAAYTSLLALDPEQVMGQQQQLDLCNQLMAEHKHDLAARAYELFLKTYQKYPQREQVQLVLGLIYARYLDRKQRAVELLTAALPRLTSPDEKELAQKELAGLRA